MIVEQLHWSQIFSSSVCSHFTGVKHLFAELSDFTGAKYSLAEFSCSNIPKTPVALPRGPF
ncbi:hypothetical protein DPMN_008667 [Dreissena polymorpha]|uniref:Uncharacterized protein n=1 Tax=Dreissena polymorpha TaxID=45954 RepID=A0A9D4MZ71_DREPO|nr:hypothetical protein DPMN_008667 [Dreissena polymorpha]